MYFDEVVAVVGVGVGIVVPNELRLGQKKTVKWNSAWSKI